MLNPSNGLFSLDSQLPSDWEAKYIVYLRYGLKAVSNSVEFYVKDGPHVWRNHDLGGILKQIRTLQASGHSLPPSDNWPVTGPQPLAMSPLDVDIRAPSWLIIELDCGSNWQFRTDGLAFTTKTQKPGNAAVRHITFDSTHNPKLSIHPPQNDCKVACFAVMSRQQEDMHGINIHVEFVQGSPPEHYIDVIIDPDVGNNGGSVYPFVIV